MQLNHRYLLDQAASLTRAAASPRILDFGCGTGHLVQAGRAHGLSFYGADVFYGGNRTRDRVVCSGLWGSAIREIRDGRLAFDDGFFDLVVSNQVFEHVDDLDAALREIHRVLKPGGALLALFPSLEVIREGHIGIPWAHRFPRDSRTRFLYVLLLRTLGLGYFKDQADSRAAWARKKLDWLDRYTRYRNRREIRRSFRKYFTLEEREAHHIRYRLRSRPATSWAAPIIDLPGLNRAGRHLFHLLGGLVLLARRA